MTEYEVDVRIVDADGRLIGTRRERRVEVTLRELFSEVGLNEPDWGSFFGLREAAIARHYFAARTSGHHAPARVDKARELLRAAVSEGLAIGWSTAECSSGACGPLYMHVGKTRIALAQ